LNTLTKKYVTFEAMIGQSAPNKNNSDIANLHHRAHDSLRDYWSKLRGSRPFPREDEIDPDEIAEIWDSCFLISLDSVTYRIGYRYSYLGTALVSAFGDNTDNNDVALRLLSTARVPNANKMTEAINTRQPVIDDGEFINNHNMNIRYRTCIVPFGYDNGQVSHLFGVMRWKAY